MENGLIVMGDLPKWKNELSWKDGMIGLEEGWWLKGALERR
jgi:hypothetical protein